MKQEIVEPQPEPQPNKEPNKEQKAKKKKSRKEKRERSHSRHRRHRSRSRSRGDTSPGSIHDSIFRMAGYSSFPILLFFRGASRPRYFADRLVRSFG